MGSRVAVCFPSRPLLPFFMGFPTLHPNKKLVKEGCRGWPGILQPDFPECSLLLGFLLLPSFWGAVPECPK